jgi:hypothetical protein
VPSRAAKQAVLPRTATTFDEQDLERALLRKSVGALADEAAHCTDCGRTPLIGETLYRYAAVAICELCRPLRRGEPETRERVRSSEAGQTVRVHRLT